MTTDHAAHDVMPTRLERMFAAPVPNVAAAQTHEKGWNNTFDMLANVLSE